MTQQAMAERLQIAYRTYQTWEAGTMPEWDNLKRLADSLGVRPEEITGEAQVPEPSQMERMQRKLDELLEVSARIEQRLSAVEAARVTSARPLDPREDAARAAEEAGEAESERRRRSDRGTDDPPLAAGDQ